MVEEPKDAVTCTVSLKVTLTVEIEKVAEAAPAATLTVLGTTALDVFELKFTTVPPVGAGPFNVTVAVVLFPPATVAG